MEKKLYKSLKSLREKVSSGQANFKERNILKIVEKRLKQGKTIRL